MNIYLVASESYRLINAEIKKIVKDHNYLTLNLNKVSLEDVLKEASYPSIDNEKKIIVLTNASFFGTNKLSDKENELLTGYLNNPLKNTILIFTTLNGIDLRKKIVKIIKENYKLINIPNMTYKDKENELIKYIKNNGYTIDHESCQYILNNTSSLDMMYNECDKIFLYYNKPGKIDYKVLKLIVGSIVDNNNFHFVSAVIAKDLEKALTLFKSLKVYKVEVLSLIILLAREYRLMYYLKRLQHQKYSLGAICKELSLQDWQVNKLYNNSIFYKEEELLKNIKMLADIDLGIKKGLLDKDSALISFLVTICN